VAAELVACPKCSRNNNPLRQTCIYCGAELPAVEEISAQMLAARAAQSAEKLPQQDLDPLSQISSQLQQSLLGFNLIMLPSNEQPEKAVEAISSITNFNDVESRQLLELSSPMPLLRLQHEAEARAFQEKLEAAGLQIRVLKDEKLQPGTPNKRAKRLAIEDGKFDIHFESTADPPQSIPVSDIKLIIEGKIRHRQFQTTEQNKGFGKSERELTDAVEFVDEQPLVDVYTSSLDTSFRIRSETFDYSGLGGRMKLTTTENFRTLLAVLQEAAVAAIYDTEFKNCMRLLEMVWPSTSRNESMGLRRSQILSAGKISTRVAQHFDNEMQFNRYSRMRYYLIKNGEENN
jgi:hypothetical protein